MEVAGLVLGAIPLAINALQGYRSFLTSLRNAQRDLDSIVRRLRTQQRILENTCERLLDGIVSPPDVEPMIQKPLDPLWTRYDEPIKLRLDQDWDVFQDTAREMKSIVKSLQAKLALDDNGKSILRDRASFFAKLREGARFTLRSKDYDDLIIALNEHNNSLHILVTQIKELEPSRQSRMRTSFIQTVQQLTEGIYTSLCASMNCKCSPAHGFGLELSSRKSALVHNVDKRHATKSTFGIAFGSNRAKPTERWEQFHASLVSNRSGPRSVPLMPRGVPSGLESSGIGKIPVTGSILTIPNSPLTSTTSTMTCQKASAAHSPGIQAGTQNDTFRIEDLCGEFVEGKENLNGRCFGFVTDKTNEFYLFHKSCDPTGSTLVTLRDILSQRHPQLPGLDYSQTAKIAYALSSNLLPLVTTPWLEKVLRLDEIAFFRVKDGLQGWVYHMDRPYLAKSSTSAGTTGLSCGHQAILPSAKYKPLMILSLAFLIVQIVLGHSMEEFQIAERSCFNCLMSQRAAALQKVATVLAKGNDIYADVVTWCLENFLSALNLDDAEFSHRYYSTVVAKLESLVDIVESFSSS